MSVTIGRTRPLGSKTCGFEGPGGCTSDATRHFMRIIDGVSLAACDDHSTYIRSKQDAFEQWDEHTFSPECGMPGTLWRFPYEDEEEGYCFFPAPDDASAVAAVDLTAGASR